MSKRNMCLVFAFLILARCGGNGDGAGGESEVRTQKLEVVTVTKGVLVSRIQSSGIIKGIQEIMVTSKTQGTIESVSFEIGDYKKQGETMVVVDNAEAAYNLQQARQALNAARLNLQAISKLYSQGAASDAELANARSAFNSAKSQYEAAKEANANTRIRAPIKGYIATKEPAITVGNNISPATPVALIVDLSRIRIEIPLGESNVSMVDTGALVMIIPFAQCKGDSQFSGKVTAVAAGANPATGSFTAVITADNPCGIALKSGMTATVIVQTSVRDSTFIIPTSSIIDSNKVFLFQGGEVRKRQIVRGETVGNRTEALSGLDSGMVVVITPPPGLTSGASVDTALLGESGSWQ